jgi:hypothetical protein
MAAGKATKAAVFALLSRVYLYLGNDPASVITTVILL